MESKIELWTKYKYDDNYSDSYYKEIVIPNQDTEKEFEASLGRYKIIYYASASPIFGVNCAKYSKHVKNRKIIIFEDDIQINELEIYRRIEAHIIMGGDGKTRETTYFVAFDDDGYRWPNKYSIYNMKNEKCHTDSLNSEPSIGMIDLNDKYFMHIAGDIMTHYIYASIIEKKYFFDVNAEFYDDGRITFDTDGPAGAHIPVEATHEGFILNKIKMIYTERAPYGIYRLVDNWSKFVKYEDIEDYNFYGETHFNNAQDAQIGQLENACRILGINIDKDKAAQVITNTELDADGRASISFNDITK